MKTITIVFLICVVLITNSIFANEFNKNLNNTYFHKNEPTEISIKTTKQSYKPREEITVIFSGLPGNKKDWINVIKANSADKSYGSNWKYTNGKTSGSLTFSGMYAEGEYEVRVYFDNGLVVKARYKFTVSKNVVESKPDHSLENSPARSYIGSLNKRLDELAKLNNEPKWGEERFMMSYSSWLETATIALENAKSADPNYDVSALEKKLQTYQSAYDNKSNQVNSNELSKEDYIKMVTAGKYKLSPLTNDQLGSGAGWVHSYFNTSKYLKNAKELNYPALLKKTIEGDAKIPDHNRQYDVKKIKGFEAEYKTFYDGTLNKVINGLIEGAYENKAKNAQEAIKYATQAKELSDAALLILPNDAGVKSLNKDASSTYEKVAGDVLAKVYTSDFHKKNAGKVVFFTKKPIIKAENSSTVKASYKAGEYIYAMAYLKGSFKDLTKATNTIKVTTNIFVDGTKKASHEFAMAWAMVKEGKTYLFMEIVPNPATNKHSGPAKFAKALANISPRNHTIKVTLDGMQQGSSYVIHLAEGEFKLDCSTGQDKLAAFAVKYREKSLADIYMPKSKMNNTILANSMKKALQDEAWEKGKKVQRVVITGSGWKITKHKVTGKILYRSIPAAVAFKTSEGYCKYWNLTFKQVYNGSSYGQTVQGGVGSIVDMSCKNIFK